MRANALLDVHEVSLPPQVEKLRAEGKEVEAAYQIEVIGRIRGHRWDLHRRTVVEESAIFGGSAGELSADGRHIHLATTFLSNGARTKKGRRSLGFSLDLRVQVPEYVVDRRWFRDDHFDGGYLFRDKINLQASFSSKKGWMLRYGYDSKTPNRATRLAEREEFGDDYRFLIPVIQKSRPGLRATLRLETALWNLPPG